MQKTSIIVQNSFRKIFGKGLLLPAANITYIFAEVSRTKESLNTRAIPQIRKVGSQVFNVN